MKCVLWRRLHLSRVHTKVEVEERVSKFLNRTLNELIKFEMEGHYFGSHLKCSKVHIGNQYLVIHYCMKIYF